MDKTSARVRFSCRSWLPGAELRLAVALGTLAPLPEGTYYPQHWELPVLHAGTFATALGALGVALVTSSNADTSAAMNAFLRTLIAGHT